MWNIIFKFGGLMDLFEKTISNEIIYEGKIFNLEKVRVLLPNGKF